MERGYRLRFYPTPRQERHLAREFGAARWTWNFALGAMRDAYRQRKQHLSINAISRQLTLLKRGERPWLREVSSTTLTQSLRDLQRGFQNFFAKRAKYPRFKRRKLAQSVRYQLDPRQEGSWEAGKRLVLAKLGPLHLVWSRIPKGRPKMVTLRRDSIGRYFASFALDERIEKLPEVSSQVGIDLGLTSLVTLSDGTKVEPPRALRKALGTLAHWGRAVSRRKMSSNRRKDACFRLAKVHAHVANSRRDWIHKLTTPLVRDNQTLVVEDLNNAGLLRNRHVSLSLSDAAFGEIVRQLEYKCAFYGRQSIKVGRFYPSTKRCSGCGFVLESLPLKEREWTCPECGVHHDRDINAARNLLEEGLRIAALPPGGREVMRVEGGNPRNRFPDRPMKRESQGNEAQSQSKTGPRFP